MKYQLKIPNKPLYAGTAKALFRNEIVRTLNVLTNTVKNNAQRNAPVGATGNLRNSIQDDVQGLSGIVFTNLEYAPVVEYGRRAAPVSRDADTGLGKWIRLTEKGQKYFNSLREKWPKITLESAIFLLKRGKKRKRTKAQPFMSKAWEESQAFIRNQNLMLLKRIAGGLA